MDPDRAGQVVPPLHFAADGWSELMRLEPGSAVAVHRHAGEVHTFTLAGTREIFGTGERVGPGSYVHEPAGTIDGWAAIGEEPCVVPIKVSGAIEHLAENGQVIESVSADTQRALYLAWRREHAVQPAAQILSGTGGTGRLNPTAAACRHASGRP